MILATARRVAGFATTLPLIGGLFPGRKPTSHSPGSRSGQIPLSPEVALRNARFRDACRKIGSDRELEGGKPHPKADRLHLGRNRSSGQPLLGALTAEETANQEFARAQEAARARMPKGI